MGPGQTTTTGTSALLLSPLSPPAGSRRVTVTQVGLDRRRGEGHRLLRRRTRLVTDRDSWWGLLPDRRRLLPDCGQHRADGRKGRTDGYRAADAN